MGRLLLRTGRSLVQIAEIKSGTSGGPPIRQLCHHLASAALSSGRCLQVGATSYNEGSSRSHTILRVAVESSVAPGSAAAARGDPRTLSYLKNLIDLAGSESARVR